MGALLPMLGSSLALLVDKHGAKIQVGDLCSIDVIFYLVCE